MALPDARTIETAALNCWPDLECEYDGAWIRRAANGYTKRANSVQSLDPADDDNAAVRIAAAVRWYEARRLPAVFRITPLAGPGLVAALDGAGWDTIDHSRLMAMEFVPPPPSPRAEWFDPLDHRFLSAQQMLQGYSDETVARLRAVLGALEVPARGIVLYGVDGKPMSSALMSVAQQIVITGNVVTAASERRKGYGGAMMRSGLAWAWSAGARVAALNVAAENAAAQGLYGRLGYRPQYDYYYRVARK